MHLVQGYLLARPGPPWPVVEHTGPTRPGTGGAVGVLPEFGEVGLQQALAGVDNVLEACEIAAETLYRHSHLLTSLYLERNNELRCVAQRGLWQVLDGMPGTAGITGRTWATATSVVVEDVSTDPHYRVSVPGVVSEICVPVVVNGDAVGSLNVESLGTLSPQALAMTETVARVLADRLAVIGVNFGNSRWHRAAHASVAISGLRPGHRLPDQVLHRFSDAAEMDSACLIIEQPKGPAVLTAVGPLADSLVALDGDELRALTTLVGDIRSCYTAGDATSPGFVGTESLRSAGARAVVVLPLWAHRERFGTVVLAHSRPLRLTGDRVEPLELLADHVAAVLEPMLGSIRRLEQPTIAARTTTRPRT